MEGNGGNIPGEGYDIVFCNSVLHWCKDKDLIFKQVEKSLKEGGTFGFVVPSDFDAEKDYFTPENMFSPECRQAMINGVHYAPSNEYLKLSIENNFILMYFKRHLRDWKFKNVNELIEFLAAHHKGQFDSTHFNVEAITEHFGSGEIVITVPYITVILNKKSNT